MIKYVSIGVKIMNLFNEIKQLKPEEEKKFIKKRLSELDTKETMEVGAETSTSIYSDFFTKRIKVNVGTVGNINYDTLEITNVKYNSVKYDDDNMYRFLINQIKINDNPYDAVYLAIRSYLYPNGFKKNQLKKRSLVYRYLSSPFNKPVSIGIVHRLNTAACCEIAGAAQNMFRFLNIESDCVLSGGTNGRPHSFNVIYPKGRNEFAVLFDASVDSELHPTMYWLDERKKRELFLNRTIIVTDRDLTKFYKKMLNLQPLIESYKDEYCILKDARVKTAMIYKYPELKKRVM